MRIRVALDLRGWVNIFQNKGSITIVGALCLIGLYVSLSFHYFISAIMAKIVHAALTYEHAVEVAKTNWAVVLELVPQFSVLREEVND